MKSKGNRHSSESNSSTPTDHGSAVLGESAWPTVVELAAQQSRIEDDSMLWLGYCKALAERRLPEEMFKQIPEDIWRFRVAGSKVVVMRTPQVEQLGSLILPQNSQRINETGWVLTVGPQVHTSQEPNIRGRTYEPSNTPYSDFVPLLLVGDLVLLNRHAGQALVGSLLDEGAVHRSQAPQFVMISIADIFGPMVGVKQSDWATVQPIIAVPQTRIIS